MCLYRLKKWIPMDKIHWFNLSENPNVIGTLEKNFDRISWHKLSENLNAIYILEQYFDKISWFYL